MQFKEAYTLFPLKAKIHVLFEENFERSIAKLKVAFGVKEFFIQNLKKNDLSPLENCATTHTS